MRVPHQIAKALAVVAFGLAAVACTERPEAPLPNPPPALAVTRIEMERTPCPHSECRSYRIALHPDGRVTYEGRESVFVLGEREGLVDPQVFEELVAEFEQIDFANQRPIQEEGPWTRVSMTLHLEGGGIVTMSAESNEPMADGDEGNALWLRAWLHETAGRIDRVTGSRQWVEGW